MLFVNDSAAKRMFLEYGGQRRIMADSGEDVLKKYESFKVPKEKENEWRREYIQKILKAKAVSFQEHSYACVMSQQLSDPLLYEELMLLPQYTEDNLMFINSWQLVEYCRRKNKLSDEQLRKVSRRMVSVLKERMKQKPDKLIARYCEQWTEIIHSTDN